MKEIKCKKCGLTYPRKKHECPYCHTKRPNIAPIVIIIILAVIAVPTYIYKDEVISVYKSLTNSNSAVYDGIKVELKNYTAESNTLTDMTEQEQIKMVVDFTNTTTEDKQIMFEIITYADNYLVSNSWALNKNKDLVFESLLPNKSFTKEITVYPNKEWKKIEVYCGESFGDNHKLMFTINNN